MAGSSRTAPPEFDMRLTSYTDYCLRVLIYVAAHPEGRGTIAEIAQSYGISENHLVKVVHFLGKVGFLLNVRGRGGGLGGRTSPFRGRPRGYLPGVVGASSINTAAFPARGAEIGVV